MHESARRLRDRGNIEIFLSKLYATRDKAVRDNLLGLLALEQSGAVAGRVHIENAQRRVGECRKRMDGQRSIVALLPPEAPAGHPDKCLLETLETVQPLLERHLLRLHETD